MEDESKGNWRNPIRYYAADQASSKIEGYFYDSAKKTEEIIINNLEFLNGLKDIKNIVVIGHSLSPVDHPYFRKIIEVNNFPEKLHWEISYHTEEGKYRIKKFANMFDIAENNIEMFHF